MEAVCIMFDIKPVKVAAPDGRSKVDDFWDPAKKMMADSKFLQSLFDCDKDNIKVEVIEKIRPYTTSPDFEPELIGKASKAAKGLCQWVRAMEVCGRVAKVVAPKRAALAQAEAEYAEVSELLRQKKQSLAEVEGKIQALQEQFDETNAKKEDLARQVEDCSNKL